MVQKIENTPCSKCGGETSIKWIPSTGMDVQPTRMQKTCNRCGFQEMIKDLDKDNWKHA